MRNNGERTTDVYPLELESTDPHEILVRMWAARLMLDGNRPQLLVGGSDARFPYFEVGELCGVVVSGEWSASGGPGPSIADVRQVLQHNLDVLHARFDRDPEPPSSSGYPGFWALTGTSGSQHQ